MYSVSICVFCQYLCILSVFVYSVSICVFCQYLCILSVFVYSVSICVFITDFGILPTCGDSLTQVYSCNAIIWILKMKLIKENLFLTVPSWFCNLYCLYYVLYSGTSVIPLGPGMVHKPEKFTCPERTLK